MPNAFVVVLCTLSASALAPTEPLDLQRLPSAFVGERVKLSSIHCIDEVHGGYLCVIKAGGSLLAIDAVILGEESVRSDVDQYIEDNCKGTINLDSEACVFDATFTVKSSQRESTAISQLTRFFTTDIELERSKP